MNLYQNVVNISKPYLGIATEQFLERQCKSHLSCTPEQLTADKIVELAKWIEISGSLIMDRAKATELKERILKLAA